MSRPTRSRGRRRRRPRNRVIQVLLTVAFVVVAGGIAAVAAGVSETGPRPRGTASASRPPSPVGVAAGAGLAATAHSGDTGDGATREAQAAGSSRYTDHRATAYFRSRWRDGAARRIREIRTTGRYLRIYTDLPESADNSAEAITLCERGLEYLIEQGEAEPVVFVQAKFGENGNPVLANVLGSADGDCRVTYPRPRGH